MTAREFLIETLANDLFPGVDPGPGLIDAQDLLRMVAGGAGAGQWMETFTRGDGSTEQVGCAVMCILENWSALHGSRHSIRPTTYAAKAWAEILGWEPTPNECWVCGSDLGDPTASTCEQCSGILAI